MGEMNVINKVISSLISLCLILPFSGCASSNPDPYAPFAVRSETLIATSIGQPSGYPTVITSTLPHYSKETTTPTPSHLPNVSISPTSTPSTSDIKVDWKSISSLPLGYYILYRYRHNLYVLSQDGRLNIPVIIGNDLAYGVNTYDGKRIIVYDIGHTKRVVEVNTQYIKNIPYYQTKSGISRCENSNIPAHSISPNLQWEAFICAISLESGEIAFRNINDEQVLFSQHVETRGGKPEEYFTWSWSPDSNWLAYYRVNDYAFPDTSQTADLMLIDTSCLNQREKCPLEKIGPFRVSNQPISGMGASMWSPDSRFFISTSDLSGFPLLSFDVTQRSFTRIDAQKNQLPTFGMAWSPDGKSIAFSSGKSIYLLPSKDGDAEIVSTIKDPEDLQVVGWLSTYPSPIFKLGSVLFITGAGNNLRIRQSPSLQAITLGKLSPGDIIQIVDGPVQVENYKWWKLNIEKNSISGWAVENADWYALYK